MFIEKEPSRMWWHTKGKHETASCRYNEKRPETKVFIVGFRALFAKGQTFAALRNLE